MLKRYFKSIPIADFIAGGLVISFSLIYALMSVVKHNHFQTFGWDLGVFDHGIWQWSQFRIPLRYL